MIDYAEPLADFQDSILELADTRARLADMTECDHGLRDMHLDRLDWAMSQVETVQNMLVRFQSASRHARRSASIDLPDRLQETALYALKGGCAVLGAVTFSARQFIDRTENPDAPNFLAGVLSGINWAAVGKMIGSIEGGIRK